MPASAATPQNPSVASENGTVAEVSVVIAVKDGAETIARAIRSVLNQTYQNLEVVVVVNGSRDDTALAVRNFKEGRVRCLEVAEPGRSRARNIGLRNARGEYVLFLDADDEILPDKIANGLAYLGSGCDAVQGGTRYLMGEGGMVETAPPGGKTLFQDLMVKNVVPLNSMIVRRSICSDFPEDREYCEDWVFWIRTLANRRIESYSKIDSLVHVSGASTSSDVAMMKSYEIPVYLVYQAKDLPILGRIKRFVLLTLAVLYYSETERIAVVESALDSAPALRRYAELLRRRPSLRRLQNLLTHCVFGINREGVGSEAR